MQKIKVEINDELVGNVLAQDIYSETGIMILPIQTHVTKYVLKKLQEFRIENAVIFKTEEVDSYEKYIQKAKEDYKQDVEEFKGVIQNLAAGKAIDYGRVEGVSDDIYSKMNESYALMECVNNVKIFDEYTYSHSVNVSVYAMLLSKWMGMNQEQIKEVVTAALLHDVGKSKIPNSILNKGGSLSVEEFQIMKKHSYYGYEIVRDLKDVSMDVKSAVLMHHEKENGKGYPLGVRGSEKNLYAKIITVADIFDAITSKRVYKDKQTPFEAFKEIEKIGYDVVDARVMMTLFANMPYYYVGSKVKLNSGEVGEVVYVPSQCIFAPVVKVNDRYLDISKAKNASIEEFL